ncbi:glutathione synthetase, chloroplastic [Oryza brachyantha]|uniref:Glutathione synthetase n=1 Tax=Oryza brachyantha TaxID=4533 RepID=J3NDU6_ORYBR|nr:glutathione synthetase, chloroplastic [Oryza brachyantha]
MSAAAEGMPPAAGPEAVGEMVREATAWCALHGLVVGDRADPRSGTVPGVGLVHAPFSLLPTHLPVSCWRQACELAPIFNELVDRVSLDGDFLQDSLSKTKQVDDFTSRLLDIHRKMMEINKEENIRLGLHRSDYMLDSETDSLLQIELNTISASFPGLGSLVSELHRSLIDRYGNLFCLDSKKVPENAASCRFAKALARAWDEFNVDSAVVMMIVQPEERNMYDQYWLAKHLKESHGITTIRKTLSEVEAEGHVLPDGTLVVDGRTVSVVYFRAGYTPNDYPSEAEWTARLLMEQSSAVKCPSISYHLVGTKKIQQELAKPNVLERFLENKEEIAKIRKCFAGLWSLDDEEIVKSAIQKPELFVLKPQREGGGNNIYGLDVRETLARLQKEGGDALAAYILMQRIFPKASLANLVRGGVCHEALAISELGIYGAYLRNKGKVVMNEQSGYLMRTKVSSSDEGGVAAGFAVLDSLYLTDKLI